MELLTYTFNITVSATRDAFLRGSSITNVSSFTSHPALLRVVTEEVEHGGVHRWRIDGADSVDIISVYID